MTCDTETFRGFDYFRRTGKNWRVVNLRPKKPSQETDYSGVSRAGNDRCIAL